MKYILLLLLITSSVQAQEIEEAQGLGEESVTTATAPSANETFRYRAYVFLEGLAQKGSMPTNQFPNLETSLASDYKTSNDLTAFVDGVIRYYDNTKKTQGFLNQIGMRFQAAETINIALGKERNRRSPGIIISPSDLLFAQTNLPGLREDRRGIWLARASYQLSKSSYDFFILPINSVDDGGLPTSQSRYQGTLARTLQQFGNWDVSFTAGQLSDVTQAGLAIQGIAGSIWKTYYEVGYKEKNTNLLGVESKNVTQHLLGVSFEGSDDFNFKTEYLYNGQGLERSEFDLFRVAAAASTSISSNYASTLFLRKQYGILTASILEIKNHINLIFSVIKSLDDSSFLFLSRAEYLLSDHLVLGLAGVFINGGTDTQFLLKTFDEQFSLDIKYTF